MKDIYWYLSGLGIVDNVYQIPLNCFTDFISQQTNIIDGTSLKFADTDTMFYVMTNTRPKELAKILPSKGLVRF